jgi:hypothetical protein
LGIRLGSDTESRAATAAENKPVYSVPDYARRKMYADTRTHKNEDPIGILLPAIGHLIVFFLCSLGVHGKERSRAVPEVGFSLRWR